MSKSKDTVVLCNLPPSVTSQQPSKGSVYPSTALMLIGTILRKNGYHIILIDGAYDDNHQALLETTLTEYADRINFVGISMMTAQVPLALNAARIIKAFDPKIPVVCGGAHPTLFPEQTLNDNNIDIIVINEGTGASLNLANAIASGTSLDGVPGIGFKESDGKKRFTDPPKPEHIKDLPFFDFDIIDVDKYIHPLRPSVYQGEFPGCVDGVKVMPILTGLGCPYKCQFCINSILKRNYRFRSAATIVDEIERLISAYDVDTFLFLDEDFFVNRKRMLEMLELVEARKLSFNWRMWCRIDHFKEDYINENLLRRMLNIGQVSLVMGAESGNQRVLDKLNKGIKIGQTINSVKTISKTDVFARYSFIVGNEDETLDEIKNTFKFCSDLKQMSERVDIAPFIFRLYPGSPIYDRLRTKWSIDIPEKLESWEPHLIKEETYIEMPWAPEKFQANAKLIQFYIGTAFGYSAPTKSLKDVLRHVLKKIGRARLKYFIFQFPFEYYLFKFRRNQNKRK